MFGANLTEWLGRRVQDYVLGVDVEKVPDNPIFRFRQSYSVGLENSGASELLDEFIKSGAADSATAIVIGLPDEEASFDEIAKYLISKKEKFPRLNALFLGDFTYEERECSWSHQTDAGPLLAEFPAMEHFAIRGAGISFSPVRNICLQSLSLQTGGLSRSILSEQLPQCVFPDLKKLDIMTGDSGYGWDGSIKDISNFLSNSPFPSVTDLGLRNAEDGDDLCKSIVGSGILDSIKKLDLSDGTVGNEGAKHLLESGKLDRLEKLTISRHYITEEFVTQLTKSGAAEVVIDDFQDDAGPDDRYVAVGE